MPNPVYPLQVSIPWTCTICQCQGEIRCPSNEHVDQRWNRVLAAHLECSPACAPNGDRGIALRESREPNA